MAEVESEQFLKRTSSNEMPAPRKGVGRRWADVYQYAYSSALTDIVDQLEQMRIWTTKIVGQRGFDPIDPEEWSEQRRRKDIVNGLYDGNVSR
jgi:hypothetical protein